MMLMRALSTVNPKKAPIMAPRLLAWVTSPKVRPRSRSPAISAVMALTASHVSEDEIPWKTRASTMLHT